MESAVWACFGAQVAIILCLIRLTLNLKNWKSDADRAEFLRMEYLEAILGWSKIASENNYNTEELLKKSRDLDRLLSDICGNVNEIHSTILEGQLKSDEFEIRELLRSMEKTLRDIKTKLND